MYTTLIGPIVLLATALVTLFVLCKALNRLTGEIGAKALVFPPLLALVPLWLWLTSWLLGVDVGFDLWRF